MNNWWNLERYYLSKRSAYIVTLVLLALSTIIRISPLHFLGSCHTYLTYYPTVIIAAVLGGFFAGALATVLACLIVSILWSPLTGGSFLLGPPDWLSMSLFAFNGILISSLAASMRHANKRFQKTNSKFHTLLEATPDCLIIVNKDGQIVFANKVSEKIFGYTSTELIGQKIEVLIPSRYSAQHVKQRQHYVEQPCTRPMGSGLDLFGKHKDGHEFSVEISLSPIETDDGLLVLATVRDITARKKVEDEKAMLAAVVESSAEAFIGKDLKGIISSWNKAAETLYGYTKAEIVGCSIKKLLPPDKEKEFDDIMLQILQGKSIKNKESVSVHKDGHLIPISITISPIVNAKGVVIGASTTVHDISQQKFFEEKLKYLAEHDSLTGLINRPLFETRIEQAISLANRQHSEVAVCFLDIDNFKQTNDLHGHTTGDLLLRAVAKRIKACIRDMDTLARLGGDEFALILLDIKNKADVIKIIKKIIEYSSKDLLIEDKIFKVTLSIGISLYPRDDGRQLLIEKADAAMYYVKNHGKNNFKFFDATTTPPD